MNFEESNQFVKQMEKNNKSKKTILTVLILCTILIIVLIGMMTYFRKQDEAQLKMFVDDKEVKITQTLLLQAKEGAYYINVKELASLLGYSYQKGEYKHYTEDAESCYLKSPYEIISMNANSNTLTKYILNETEEKKNEQPSKDLIVEDKATGKPAVNIVVDSKNETEEIFSLEEPIRYVNDELYVSFLELSKIFSVQLNTAQTNRIYINSLPKLAQSLNKVASNMGYTEVSNLYENLTAIADNMLVVGDGTSYGVVSLTDGKEIISLKYDKIVYRQNTEEFFVTAENSVGIVDKTGRTVVKPTEFDNITSFDELNKLYLVEKDGKYGVVNHNGDTIVYAEYDSIGVANAEAFSNEEIRSFNILFEECIPVNYNEKVGLIDIEGNERLKCVYDALGYVETTSNASQDNKNKTGTTSNTTNTAGRNDTTELKDYDPVLTIPESLGIKGIVVKWNGLYGIYDVEVKRLIIPCACTKIYSRTKAGVTKYYLEYDGQELELENYLLENDLISIKESNE